MRVNTGLPPPYCHAPPRTQPHLLCVYQVAVDGSEVPPSLSLLWAEQSPFEGLVRCTPEQLGDPRLDSLLPADGFLLPGGPRVDTMPQVQKQKRARIACLDLLAWFIQLSAGLSFFLGQELARNSEGIPDIEKLLLKLEGSHKLALSFYSRWKL